MTTTTEILKSVSMAALLALPEPYPYLTTCTLFLLRQAKKRLASASPWQMWMARAT
jgi:hypothetical protein